MRSIEPISFWSYSFVFCAIPSNRFPHSNFISFQYSKLYAVNATIIIVVFVLYCCMLLKVSFTCHLHFTTSTSPPPLHHPTSPSPLHLLQFLLRHSSKYLLTKLAKFFAALLTCSPTQRLLSYLTDDKGTPNEKISSLLSTPKSLRASQLWQLHANESSREALIEL